LFQVFKIGTFTDPTSVTTAFLGMALIKIDEGFRSCLSGKAI